jgi:hypothetical protein
MKKMFSVGMTRYCAICKRRTTFYLAGKQPFPKHTLKLWNCHECGGTQCDKTHTGNTAMLQEVRQ